MTSVGSMVGAASAGRGAGCSGARLGRCSALVLLGGVALLVGPSPAQGSGEAGEDGAGRAEVADHAPVVRAPDGTRPPAAAADTLRRAKELLGRLVAIDTTPSGSTAPAVELLADVLRAAGFAAEDLAIVGPRPERSNLVARLRGRGGAPPILFLSHLDVVEAERADWSVDPFVLTERDGYLYGRGTLDIKGEVANLVENFAALARAGYVPRRDFVLALTADEEGGEENGVRWLLEHRRDLLDVAWALNTDAGGLQLQHGELVRMPIQTSEKVYASFELEVTGPGGHSSLPTRDNVIHRLAAALARLDGLEFPVMLDETRRMFFTRLAEQAEAQADGRGGGAGGHDPRELAAAFRGVTGDPPDPAAVARLAEIPLYNGTLRTVCTPTLLAGGHAENALPQRATATLQCRLLPGHEVAAVAAAITARIADPQVRVRALGDPQPAPSSPYEPELFSAVEVVTTQMWPGVPVVPVMDPWSTDGAHLRRAGVPVYGVSGIYFDVDDVRSHGRDERIAEAAFAQGLEFLARLLRRLGDEGVSPGAATP
jgi:acetylornithine deacetylase/succinyl-diaminopimelate desuccinylase-like protein